MRIALWSGSLGLASSNRAALVVAARWLAEAGADAEWVDGLGEVPPFRSEQADDPPVSVQQMQAAFGRSDAVLIAAPEYAGGVAGVAKNALDWMVGSGSLYHRLAGVLSVGTTGGHFAQEQLVRTLSYQGALTVAALGIESPRTKMADGVFVDHYTIGAIEAWAAEVVMARGKTAADRLQLVASIVEPYGISIERFGTGER